MVHAAPAADGTLSLLRLIRHFRRRPIGLQLKPFGFFATRLDQSQICGRGRLDPALLGRTDRGVALAGVMLLDKGRAFHEDDSFVGQAGVFSNVDGDVCVERLQRFGEELVGEGVEAVRAPVKPGPFQKVKSSKTSTPKFALQVGSLRIVADSEQHARWKCSFLPMNKYCHQG